MSDKNVRVNTERLAAVFDLDHTITRSDTYLRFLLFVLIRNPARIFRCFHLPVAVLRFRMGAINNSCLKEIFLTAIAGGMRQEHIKKLTQSFVHKVLSRNIRPAALKAIQNHRQANHCLILATASFDFYAEELGKILGFDTVICTRSKWDENLRLKGEISGFNCYGQHKLERLVAYFGDERNEWHLTGYSDHHSDQPFMQWVDTAIAINPTPKLYGIAQKYGYTILKW